MATTLTDLEARVNRNEEDITALVTTASETLSDVRYLKLAVQAIAAHLGVEIPARNEEDEEE